MAPDRDEEWDQANPPDDLLGPLFRPLSDAEMDKRRRMIEEPAGTLDMTSLRCLMIFMQEALA